MLAALAIAGATEVYRVGGAQAIAALALGRAARIVMYALPHQEWRIDAMILLLETAAKSGWSEGFERMQGSLLGYEDRQNDIYIERIFRPGVNRKR